MRIHSATVPTNMTEKGCSFFNQTPDSIFIPEDFQGDENLMIEMAAKFARDEIRPLQERLEKQEDGLMPNLIAEAGQLGFIGVDTAEAYGGLGLGKNLATRILEFLSVDGSFATTYGVTSGIGQLGLSLFGTEQQKQQYLPQIASGQWDFSLRPERTKTPELMP